MDRRAGYAPGANRSRRYRTPRVESPESFELYVCRTCGAWDLAPEMTHNGYCPGRTDAGHIDRVIAERVSVEPYIQVRREPCR